MELFSIPGATGIIERCVDGVDHVLVQDRVKPHAPKEHGLLEIPAGKIREFESIFACLRREIWEETGLRVVEIEGEQEAEVVTLNGYKVLSYTPFNSSQNLEGYYPIMVQAFICRAEGELLGSTNESKNLRWITLGELGSLLETSQSCFYPMHIVTLKKYLAHKAKSRG